MPRGVALSVALALAPGFAIVFGVLGVATAFHEAELLEAERQRDATALATSLAHALERHAGDAASATAHVEDLDLNLHHLDVALRAAGAPPVGPPGDRRVVGEATVSAGPARGARVVVSEPLDERDALIRRLLLIDAVGVGLGTGVSVLLALAAGGVIVQRRVDRLQERLAAVGRGELTGEPLELGSDEIGALGRAVDAMAAQLDAARSAVTAEEAARRQAELELRHADRLAVIGQTAAELAHEIGTPLNVVSGRAARIVRRGGPDAADAQIVVEQTERIATAVRALLDGARRDAIGPRHSVSIDALLDAALRFTADRERGLGVVRGTSEPGLRVDGDPVALRQVLDNLLGNALDAATSEVRVAVERAAGRVRVTIDDDGPGVPEAHRERVFEAFTTGKPAGQGTGLGLAIARRIAREHGGDVWIDAGPTGCRAVLELPEGGAHAG